MAKKRIFQAFKICKNEKKLSRTKNLIYNIKINRKRDKIRRFYWIKIISLKLRKK